MSFIESRLLTKVAYGFTGGATWQTTKQTLHSGRVVRNAERSLPLYRFNAPYNSIQPDDVDLVVAAFNASKGGVNSFRFKDHADFELTAETIGVGTGAADQTLQLIKTYTFGSESTVRTIKKPVAGTVNLFENGSPLASSVDTTTGIVTFTSATSSPQVVITATCEYDVPVMFLDDDIQFSIQNLETHSTEINLLEDLNA